MKINEMKKLVKDLDTGKQKTLKLQDKFQFKCTACGKCCLNNEILINLYDLIRLRQATKLPTQEIFKRNLVNFYLGFSSGLPVLTINFQNVDGGITRCPFLTASIHVDEIMKKIKGKATTTKTREKLIEEYKKNPNKIRKDLEGAKIDRWLCAVHKHRPMVCRLFPLGRIKRLDKEGKLNKEIFILQDKTDWCAGWETKNKIILKTFLNDSEFWHYKEGSDKSFEVLDLLLKSGFFATTKDNKDAKIKPKFEKDSTVLKFLGNLIYNFDSINYFSKDKRVIKTISGDASHEDFMYVVKKVEKVVNLFVKSYQLSTSQGSLDGLNQFEVFINNINLKGGEKNGKNKKRNN